MARDRKRAKQRQQRRPRRGASSPTLGQPVRADLPGALGHASGDVEEFDAALIRGAGGVPVAPEELPPDAPPADGANGADGNGALSEADLLDADASSGDGGRRGGGIAIRAGGEDAEAALPSDRPEAPREHRQALPRRAIGFLRASWAELQRVQWPDRPQVSQATAVVLGFVAVAGAYLGAADWVAQKIVNLIL